MTRRGPTRGDATQRDTTQRQLTLRLHTDGASRGNPGPAGIGVVIERADDGAVVAELGEYLGRATNNAAEYRALLAGLTRALELGAVAVEVCSDSELMVRQLEGRYQVRSADLAPLLQQARRLLGRFPGGSRIAHVPRGRNRRADALANAAIDAAVAGAGGDARGARGGGGAEDGGDAGGDGGDGAVRRSGEGRSGGGGRHRDARRSGSRTAERGVRAPASDRRPVQGGVQPDGPVAAGGGRRPQAAASAQPGGARSTPRTIPGDAGRLRPLRARAGRPHAGGAPASRPDRRRLPVWDLGALADGLSPGESRELGTGVRVTRLAPGDTLGAGAGTWVLVVQGAAAAGDEPVCRGQCCRLGAAERLTACASGAVVLSVMPGSG